MRTERRVGRYTKYETAELTRMFGEGYSVYKICRNLNRSQKSIRNNLIKLNLIEGELTPKRKNTNSLNINLNESSSFIFFRYLKSLTILFVLILFFIINPHFNLLEIFLSSIFIIILS